MCFVVVSAHLWRETAPISIENRVFLRSIRRDFGVQDVRINRSPLLMIVCSRHTSINRELGQNFDRAVRSARKIRKNLHENRMCSRFVFSKFLRAAGAQRVRHTI